MCDRFFTTAASAVMVMLCFAAELSAGETAGIVSAGGADIPMSIESRPSENIILAGSPKGRSKKSVKMKSTHKVKKGDSLYGISSRYSVPVDELKAANNLKGDDIKTGSLLKIPGREKKSITGKKSKSSGENKDDDCGRKAKAPPFRWPVAKVKGVKRDGEDGVKPIGIVIDSSSGANVVCAASGVVEKVGHMRGFGNYVIVRHTSGFSTVYSNISGISVSEGDKIRTGQMIGRVSADSRIHFQIDLKGRPENPLNYLPKKS